MIDYAPFHKKAQLVGAYAKHITICVAGNEHLQQKETSAYTSTAAWQAR